MLLSTGTALSANTLGLVALLAGLAVTAGWLAWLYR